MKILFICGSLEPGKDGVGDYTRRLASELFKQDHVVAILALNDTFISSNDSGFQSSENIEIETLRIASNTNLNDCKSLAKSWIKKQDPDFLSLQFVPFSFHPKGLPFTLIKLLNNITVERQWHIMFHEIWLGMNVESSTKHKLVGKIQQCIIKKLLKKIKPKVIHTHSQLYKSLLQSLEISASILPLYSNIPVYDPVKKKHLENSIQFVVFGGIAPKSNFESFSIEVEKFSKTHNKNIHLTFIGRNGPHREQWVQIWKKLNLDFTILGELSPKEISLTLNTMDVAITTTPQALIEKSGAAAAMASHTIPVISISNSWTESIPYQKSNTNGVFEYKKGQFEKVISSCNISNISSFSAAAVAEKMIADILRTQY